MAGLAFASDFRPPGSTSTSGGAAVASQPLSLLSFLYAGVSSALSAERGSAEVAAVVAAPEEVARPQLPLAPVFRRVSVFRPRLLDRQVASGAEAARPHERLLNGLLGLGLPVKG